MSDTIPKNLSERHLRIRSAFVRQGTSFCAWCRQNGIKPQNAQKAITGQWVGPKADKLVETIMEAAGL